MNDDQSVPPKLIATRITKAACLSECFRYRWWLRRDWILSNEQGEHVRGKGIVCFVMLNPSTADDAQDDPTIRRCINFAVRWGFNGLSVRNLFPYRSTDPKELTKVESPEGGSRGETELLAASTANLVVAAWGAYIPFRRDLQVMARIREAFPKKEIFCLGVTKAGHPRHPLFVRGDAELLPFGRLAGEQSWM